MATGGSSRPLQAIWTGVIVTVVGGLILWAIQTAITRSSTTPAEPTGGARSLSGADALALAPGIYKGIAVQDSKHAGSWAVTVTLSERHGVIEYRLKDSSRYCSGTLIEQPNGSWLEHIAVGTCDDGGAWAFRQSAPEALHGEYSTPSAAYVVTADLVRQNG